MGNDRYQDQRIEIDYNDAVRDADSLLASAAEVRNVGKVQTSNMEDLWAACLGNDDFGKAMDDMFARTQLASGGYEQVAARLELIATKMKKSAETLRAGKATP